MSVLLDVNGTDYAYPEVNDTAWGADATDWAVAVTNGMLQKSGGLFLLLADVDFGGSFGLISKYYTSRTANAAASGAVRLANTDALAWRNGANDDDLSLTVVGDVLTFDGVAVGNFVSVSDSTTVDLTLAAGVLSADIKPLSIDNTMIASLAGIVYAKLNLANSIVNADINAAAAIAYSKLNLAGTIVNADVNASAGIVYSKLTLTGSIVNADINASAAIAYSKLALTGSIVNADVNASAAIAYSKLNLTGTIVNADVSASAAIAYSKLATLATGSILLGNAGVPTATAMSGDVTIGATGVTSIGAAKVTNAMLAGSIDLTAKVTGVLPIANGGTNNGSLSVAAGAVFYADGSKITTLAPGSSGNVLTSGGTGAPTWTSPLTNPMTSIGGWWHANLDIRTLRAIHKHLHIQRYMAAALHFHDHK